MSLERRHAARSVRRRGSFSPPVSCRWKARSPRRDEIAAKTPNAFLPSQFDNPENPRAHRETTAREILHTMRDRSIDAFVGGVGTGGTISGVGERAPARASRRAHHRGRARGFVRRSRAASADRPRSRGSAAGFVPKNYDRFGRRRGAHRHRSRRLRHQGALAHSEGLLVGISAGAAVHVALDVARELGPGKNVVTVLSDTGERYFSLDEYFR